MQKPTASYHSEHSFHQVRITVLKENYILQLYKTCSPLAHISQNTNAKRMADCIVQTSWISSFPRCLYVHVECATVHRILEGQLHSLCCTLSFLRSIRLPYPCYTEGTGLTVYYAMCPKMYVPTLWGQVQR